MIQAINALAFFFGIFVCAMPVSAQTVFLVDKSKFQLHQASTTPEGFEIVKSYKVTLGKVSGDKQVEGDLKTPEGIYQFTTRYSQPQLKKKFGVMAFYINYPNLFDRLEKKTGFDIMLHATDDPKRLELNQDSDGCVVVSNENLFEIEKSIQLQSTPLLIYQEMKPEYLKSSYQARVREAVEQWRVAWQSKDLDQYIGSYSPEFESQGMALSAYRTYKENLNKKYSSISIELSDLKILAHPKYAIVKLNQKYVSNFSNGQVAYSSHGPKTLYLKEIDGKYKIRLEDNRQ